MLKIQSVNKIFEINFQLFIPKKIFINFQNKITKYNHLYIILI